MIKNEYSLPLTDPAFDPMSWASIFWMLDLRFTYHLVPICKGDEWKTAFNNLSPFWVFGDFFFGGVTNDPPVFQAHINDVLHEVLNKSVFVCFDLCLFFSQTVDNHNYASCLLFFLQQLLENKLDLKAKKCEFHSPFGSVSGWGQLFPPKKSSRGFLDLPTYHRFIRNCSKVAAPLSDLTSTNQPFLWSSVAEEAFVRNQLPDSLYAVCPSLYAVSSVQTGT